MEKTHWKKAFKSDYLSSSDVDGKDLILTINRVVYQECTLQTGKKFCNVAHFKESGIKPMVLNVGNSKIVKKFSGNKLHLEDWQNIKVQVYVNTNVSLGRETVEGLRIRDKQPAAKKELIPLPLDKLPSVIKWIKGGKTMEDVKSKYKFSVEIEAQINAGAEALEGSSNE